MKKLTMFIAAIAAAAMFITGCDEKPSAETVATYSNLIGASAGTVVKLLKVDQETIDNINNIVATIDKVVPNADQSFEDAWTPLMDEGIAKLKEKGKIDDFKAGLIRMGVLAAIKGLDRLFEVKPDWKKYDDIVVSAVDGFISGFKGQLCPDCYEKGGAQRAPAVDQAEVKIIAERVGVKY